VGIEAPTEAFSKTSGDGEMAASTSERWVGTL